MPGHAYFAAVGMFILGLISEHSRVVDGDISFGIFGFVAAPIIATWWLNCVHEKALRELQRQREEEKWV